MVRCRQARRSPMSRHCSPRRCSSGFWTIRARTVRRSCRAMCRAGVPCDTWVRPREGCCCDEQEPVEWTVFGISTALDPLVAGLLIYEEVNRPAPAGGPHVMVGEPVAHGPGISRCRWTCATAAILPPRMCTSRVTRPGPEKEESDAHLPIRALSSARRGGRCLRTGTDASTLGARRSANRVSADRR